MAKDAKGQAAGGDPAAGAVSAAGSNVSTGVYYTTADFPMQLPRPLPIRQTHLDSSFVCPVILRSGATKNLVVCSYMPDDNGILRSLWSLRMTNPAMSISNAIALPLPIRLIRAPERIPPRLWLAADRWLLIGSEASP